MSGSNVADLRAHLFATISALRDESNPMDIERAKAISEVATTIINTAKVEVDYIRATGAGCSEFLEIGTSSNEDKQPKALPHPPGVLGVITHRMKG